MPWSLVETYWDAARPLVADFRWGASSVKELHCSTLRATCAIASAKSTVSIMPPLPQVAVKIASASAKRKPAFLGMVGGTVLGSTPLAEAVLAEAVLVETVLVEAAVWVEEVVSVEIDAGGMKGAGGRRCWPGDFPATGLAARPCFFSPAPCPCFRGENCRAPYFAGDLLGDGRSPTPLCLLGVSRRSAPRAERLPAILSVTSPDMRSPDDSKKLVNVCSFHRAPGRVIASWARPLASGHAEESFVCCAGGGE
mmetsp:Transcript_49312/g.98295  ORF Transcript_49312/g.98295 Transcript_49312/m.98295 type:complete len:253 (-) Transcript_49312:196-954(-)